MTEYSVNFTREPIIETVITPREGCKLAVRSSKGNGQEDYFVDAVEVVSFGHSFFFRSQERPKSFLVPVSDYEIIELKETRMVLKNVSTDRSIKIGGGRETPPPSRAQQPREESRERDEERAPMDRKRDKRRRGRRGRDRHEQVPQESRDQRDYPQDQEFQQEREFNTEQMPEISDHPPAPAIEGEEKAPSFISKLFPPPPTLIKETLSRYKPAEPQEPEEFEEKTSIEETLFEHEEDQHPMKPKSDEENPPQED